jgi:hypothetical protein
LPAVPGLGRLLRYSRAVAGRDVKATGAIVWTDAADEQHWVNGVIGGEPGFKQPKPIRLPPIREN